MSALVRAGQAALVLLAAVALLAVGGAILLAMETATPGSQPERVVAVQAGPYALSVRLYKDPAQAGLALPFALIPDPATPGPLIFVVESIPGAGVDATPVRATLGPPSGSGAGSVQGAAELPVRGEWQLHIAVDGPAGPGAVDVPITATAPPPIPSWLGWSLGLVPLAALLAFVLRQQAPAAS